MLPLLFSLMLLPLSKYWSAERYLEVLHADSRNTAIINPNMYFAWCFIDIAISIPDDDFKKQGEIHHIPAIEEV